MSEEDHHAGALILGATVGLDDGNIRAGLWRRYDRQTTATAAAVTSYNYEAQRSPTRSGAAPARAWEPVPEQASAPSADA